MYGVAIAFVCQLLAISAPSAHANCLPSNTLTYISQDASGGMTHMHISAASEQHADDMLGGAECDCCDNRDSCAMQGCVSGSVISVPVYFDLDLRASHKEKVTPLNLLHYSLSSEPLLRPPILL